jgi:two-component system sensor histidine kinase KdpD
MGRQLLAYLESALAVAVAALVAGAVNQLFSLPHVTVLLLAAVLFSAFRWGLGPSLFAALCSVAVSSYFFMPPLYSFRVDAPQDIADLCVFVLVAVFTSSLAARVRRQAVEASAREARLRELFSFSRTLAGLLDLDGLLVATVGHFSTVLRRPVVLLLPSNDGLRTIPSDTPLLDDAAKKAAHRIWTSLLPGGARTQAAAAEGWTFHPLTSTGGCVGLLAIAEVPNGPQLADPAQPHLQTLLDHAATVIERATRRDAPTASYVQTSPKSLSRSGPDLLADPGDFGTGVLPKC